MNEVAEIISGIGAWLGIGSLILLSTIDIVVAIIGAAIVGPGIMSRRLSWGAINKVLQLLVVGLSFGLDLIVRVYIPAAASVVPVSTGKLVASWFIVVELVSILETLYRMDVKMPPFLIRSLAIARKNLDSGINMKVDTLMVDHLTRKQRSDKHPKDTNPRDNNPQE